MLFHTRDRRGRQPVVIYADNKMAMSDRKPRRRAPLLLLLGVVSLFFVSCEGAKINGCKPAGCPTDLTCPIGCQTCKVQYPERTCVASGAFGIQCVFAGDGCAYTQTHVQSRVTKGCVVGTNKLTCVRYCQQNSQTCMNCKIGYYLGSRGGVRSCDNEDSNPDAVCTGTDDFCLSTGKCGQCLAWYVHLTCVRGLQRCSPL